MGNNSPGFCPIAGTEATPAACVAPGIGSNPLYFDYRWHTQNVKVMNNTFRVDTDGMGCTGTRCGENSLFSNYGSRPPWSPYQGDVIDKAITFNQNNHFANNAYVGNWNLRRLPAGQPGQQGHLDRGPIKSGYRQHFHVAAHGQRP